MHVCVCIYIYIYIHTYTNKHIYLYPYSILLVLRTLTLCSSDYLHASLGIRLHCTWFSFSFFIAATTPPLHVPNSTANAASEDCAALLPCRDDAGWRPNLHTTTTTTTQRGWCTEPFVSILAHLQSQKSLPGGGGVQDLFSHLSCLASAGWRPASRPGPRGSRPSAAEPPPPGRTNGSGDSVFSRFLLFSCLTSFNLVCLACFVFKPSYYTIIFNGYGDSLLMNKTLTHDKSPKRTDGG